MKFSKTKLTTATKASAKKEVSSLKLYYERTKTPSLLLKLLPQKNKKAQTKLEIKKREKHKKGKEQK